MERDFIAHHGIKGQKWGVRRYQYADGTLTPAGKIKYGIDLHKEIKGYKASTKANYEKAKQEYKDFRKSRIRDPENKAKLKSRIKQTKEDKRIARALTKNKYKSVYFKTRDPQKKQAVKEMILKDDKFNRAIRKTAITAVGLKAVGKAVKWGTITSVVMSKDPEAGKKIVDELIKEGKFNKSLKHSELYHHGIKGQKWGERNGPPYPLDYKSHNSREKKLNPKAALTKYTGGLKATVGNKIGHYTRNELNVDLPKNDADAAKKGWRKLSSKESAMHQFSQEGGVENSKWVSPDGHREVVFTGKGRKQHITKDVRDEGTYNYYDPQVNPLGHTVYDVLPYIILGNEANDPTTAYSRVSASVKNFLKKTPDECKEQVKVGKKYVKY